MRNNAVGRPPKYPELAKIQKWGRDNIIFEDLEGQESEIKSLIATGVRAKGCTFSYFSKDKPEADAWIVRFFVGGQQLTVATLSLYAACCLSDCLQVWFEDYRRRRPSDEDPELPFNFSRESVEYHLETNDKLVEFLEWLERFFKETFSLRKSDERTVEQANARNEREKERKAKHSMRGMFITGMAEMKLEVEIVSTKLDTLIKLVQSGEARLTAIETHLKITP